MPENRTTLVNGADCMGRRHAPARRALILIMGSPGSGKSTLARAILAEMTCVYLDNNFLADAFSTSSRTDTAYMEVRPRLYSILYRITEENLAIGNSVLLDVPHVTHVQDETWCGFIQEVAARRDARLVAIVCRCTAATLLRRLKNRACDRDDWKLRNWAEWLRREPPDVHVPFPHLDIDTEYDGEVNARLAREYIERACAS